MGRKKYQPDVDKQKLFFDSSINNTSKFLLVDNINKVLQV